MNKTPPSASYHQQGALSQWEGLQNEMSLINVLWLSMGCMFTHQNQKMTLALGHTLQT